MKLDLSADALVLWVAEDSLYASSLDKDQLQYLLKQSSLDPPALAAIQDDSTFTTEGQLYWGAETEAIRQRVHELRKESYLFDQMLSHIENSDYPYTVLKEEMPHALGAFSPMQGQLRFHHSAMQGYFFDATIIEEFAHAYQASYYHYGHGQCKREELQAAKAFGDPIDTKPLAQSLAAWERFGRKSAYIESEAKIITFLIQNQAKSVSLQEISDTDDYNSGGHARMFLSRYYLRRNCLSWARVQRLEGDLNFYLDREHFWRYQKRFTRHWRRFAPGSKYCRGKYWHRPEALNALAEEVQSRY